MVKKFNKFTLMALLMRAKNYAKLAPKSVKVLTPNSMKKKRRR